MYLNPPIGKLTVTIEEIRKVKNADYCILRLGEVENRTTPTSKQSIDTVALYQTIDL